MAQRAWAGGHTGLGHQGPQGLGSVRAGFLVAVVPKGPGTENRGHAGSGQRLRCRPEWQSRSRRPCRAVWFLEGEGVL